jgi:hypothetical protein
MKFSTFTGDWCDGDWYNPATSNQAISNTSYIITSGCDGPDNKWLINESEAGDYKITINTENEVIRIEQLISYDNIYIVGDASPSGWDITDPEAFTQDDTDPFVFTWQGNLAEGELKFSTFTGDWCDGDWLLATSADQSLSATDYSIFSGCPESDQDHKWKVTASDVGEYLITVDLNNNSISFASGSPIKNIMLNRVKTKIYPNTVSDFLFIEIKSVNKANVSFYNSSGSLIYKTTIASNLNMVDLTQVNYSGLTIVKVESNNQLEVFKIMMK